MCSIAGSKNKIEVLEMLKTMIHRSPNGTRAVDDGKFSIGMGRLAIIDLKSGGLCPYQEDNYTLSFNGEIYNYIELREELRELGYKFRTESDTEVLLKSYKEWGIGCLDKLNGMFAFAIYDGEKIFLARDIAGEKPLYFTREPFRFASEAKALNFECEELPPAHYGIYDFNNLKIERYWLPKKVKIERNPVKQLERLLKDAIKIRTRADVPYALYYSGGIDSTLISTFHNFKHKFTYNDGDNEEDFKKISPRMVWHLDYPIKSFSAYGLWKLAEEASKRVKVVISGEGADELFGGYIRYVQPQFNYEAQQKFPSYKKMFEPARTATESGWDEFNGNMQELLRMGDRMASAFGIENRCPFLDRRIIDFAFSLSDEWKIKGLDTKIILRQLLKKRMPNYQEQEKKGLYCSINKWIGSSQEFEKDDYINYQKQCLKQVS